jgi:hypothetical protein
MENLCINCKTKPIQNKKRSLCYACYQKLRNNGNDFSPDHKILSAYDKIKHTAEMIFIKNYFKNNNWIYQPVIFKLNGDHYTPDFYDIENNIFIEVVGTKQAYHKNKEKYKKLVEFFPKINFEIRLESGEKLIDNMNDLYKKFNYNTWPKVNHK